MFPSRLRLVAWDGVAVAAILILVARPLAVFLTLAPRRFSVRERAFVSWVGLRGAVPIVLATFPLVRGVPKATLIFDVVFFVVIASVLLQGATTPLVARWLGVTSSDSA